MEHRVANGSGRLRKQTTKGIGKTGWHAKRGASTKTLGFEPSDPFEAQYGWNSVGKQALSSEGWWKQMVQNLEGHGKNFGLTPSELRRH